MSELFQFYLLNKLSTMIAVLLDLFNLDISGACRYVTQKSLLIYALIHGQIPTRMFSFLLRMNI